MRQRQPYRSELEKTWCERVKHASGDVDVRNGIAVKENIPTLKIEDERKQGNEESKACYTGYASIWAGGGICPHDMCTLKNTSRNRELLHAVADDLGRPRACSRTPYSKCVSSRNIWKRASISSRVSVCSRSVPNLSTANEPMTPP